MNGFVNMFAERGIKVHYKTKQHIKHFQSNSKDKIDSLEKLLKQDKDQIK